MSGLRSFAHRGSRGRFLGFRQIESEKLLSPYIYRRQTVYERHSLRLAHSRSLCRCFVHCRSFIRRAADRGRAVSPNLRR
jgi:hypothetical protein